MSMITAVRVVALAATGASAGWAVYLRSIRGSICQTAMAVPGGIDGGIIDTGKELGQLAPSAILGIVAIVSICALVRLYRDKEKDNKQYTDRLAELIQKSTEAMQANADTNRTTTGVLVEMKDAIRGCLKNHR